MRAIDYAVVGAFFVLMILIGLASIRKVRGSKDYFVGGGKVPWWLAGVSLHVSGYSGVVFVAMAAVAYTHGFSLYVWWCTPYVFAAALSAYVIAPRWSRLRQSLHIESATEYLAVRYGVGAQQLIACCGVGLKLFDVGAKWAALGVLLHGFTGLPLVTGILISGGISLIYVTVGGLWADLYTDFAQFLVQLVAGTTLLVAVLSKLGGAGALFSVWHRLPPGHARLFNGEYTPLFFVGYALGNILSSNGGTWNQATRFIAAPTGSSARKSAILCGLLYVFWPLVLFFPMWAGPLLEPHLAHPTQLYPLLVLRFLPPGLVGLSLAAMFAATMSMTTSDTNAISAVITRDLLPQMSPGFRGRSEAGRLRIARISTFVFTLLTLVVAVESEHFGGVLGLIVAWFGALIGPTSIPMVCGLVPLFKHAGSRAAVGSILCGVALFAAAVALDASMTARVGLPTAGSAVVYGVAAWWNRRRPVPARVENLLRGISAAGERSRAEA